jgi:hypothetical protein
MSSFLIAEYAAFATTDLATTGQTGVSPGVLPNTAIGLLQEPPVTTQTAITLSGTSQQSAAFAATTRFIKVWTDAEAVYALCGSNPTATTASPPLERGTTILPVVAGQKIAVRT